VLFRPLAGGRVLAHVFIGDHLRMFQALLETTHRKVPLFTLRLAWGLAESIWVLLCLFSHVNVYSSWQSATIIKFLCDLK